MRADGRHGARQPLTRASLADVRRGHRFRQGRLQAEDRCPQRPQACPLRPLQAGERRSRDVLRPKLACLADHRRPSPCLAAPAQATEGDNTAAKPGMLSSYESTYKWQAWEGRKGEERRGPGAESVVSCCRSTRFGFHCFRAPLPAPLGFDAQAPPRTTPRRRTSRSSRRRLPSSTESDADHCSKPLRQVPPADKRPRHSSQLFHTHKRRSLCGLSAAGNQYRFE